MGRYVWILVIAVFVAGCASTSSQSPQSINLLQMRLGELERDLDAKNQEISDPPHYAPVVVPRGMSTLVANLRRGRHPAPGLS